MTIAERLKSCPFCGGAPKERDSTGGWSWIECKKCGAKGPAENIGHGGEHDEAWNRREAATALTPSGTEEETAREIVAPLRLATGALAVCDHLHHDITQALAARGAMATEAACEAAAKADLPDGYQWGKEERGHFEFGKERAIAAIRAGGEP